jgi:hypothetical protein
MRGPALLLTTLLLAGCDRAVPAPGPVPLRDATQMRGYLASPQVWTLRGVDGVDQFWSFNVDGTCKAWILPDGPMTLAEVTGLDTVPADATLFTATWTATEGVLTLEQIRTDTGATVPDATLQLDWVDGKLRIGIGGRRYWKLG